MIFMRLEMPTGVRSSLSDRIGNGGKNEVGIGV